MCFFEFVNFCRITLFDYKPDSIFPMLTSLKHEPVEITRVGIGHLRVVTPHSAKKQDKEFVNLKIKEGEWIAFNDTHYEALFKQTRLNKSLREQIQNKKLEEMEHTRVSMPKEKEYTDEDLMRGTIAKLKQIEENPEMITDAFKTEDQKKIDNLFDEDASTITEQNAAPASEPLITRQELEKKKQEAPRDEKRRRFDKRKR